MQDINIPLIIIVVIVLIAVLLFLNWRNRRDRKKLFPPESTDPVEENKTEKEIRRGAYFKFSLFQAATFRKSFLVSSTIFDH